MFVSECSPKLQMLTIGISPSFLRAGTEMKTFEINSSNPLFRGGSKR